jgi:hypothetical protein
MGSYRTKLIWALFPLIAVLMALIISLSGLEFIAWLFLHKKWPRNLQIEMSDWLIMTPHGKRLKPNQRLYISPDKDTAQFLFRINALGFRGKQIDLNKPVDLKRILVLGDSITVASYLPEQDIYTSMIESSLSLSPEYRVEVLNAAVSDIGLKEEVWILKENGLKTEPDVVLLGFYLNDSRPPWGFENELLALPPSLVEFSKTLERYSYFYQWLWKRYLVTRFIGKNYGARQDYVKEIHDGKWRTDPDAYRHVIKTAYLDWGAAWDEKSWKQIYLLLDELQGLGKKNNFKLAILIFPVAMQVQSQVWDDFPQQKMKTYCQKNNIPCFDLLPLLREHKDEPIYRDNCHLTKLGHQVITPPIVAWLNQHFFGKTKSP